MSDIFESFSVGEPDGRLTPEDVEAKEFVVSLRGFDQNEVREYMRQLAASYRSALQDSQFAALALEDAKQEALAIDEKARHADIQLEDAKAMREQAVRDLEAAEALRDEANRQRDEAEAALAKAQQKAAELEAGREGDPYSNAGQQIANVLRAAEDAASDVRREANEIAAAARLDAEKTVADAKKFARDIEEEAKIRREEHIEAINLASQKCAQVMNSMRALEDQVQTVIASAMEDLLSSVPVGDVISLDPAESTEIAS